MRCLAILLLLLTFSLTRSVALAQETLFLNWQPGQLKNDRYVLKATLTTSSLHSPLQADPIEKLPDLSAKPLHITARPGQSLTVCSDRVTGYSEGGVIGPELSTHGKLPKIMVTDWQTTLDLTLPFPCPDYESSSQPYHFRNVLRSDEPFMVVLGQSPKKRHKTSNHDPGKQEAPIMGLPFTLPESISLLSGSGDGSDSDDDNCFKRPPHLPMMDKVDLSLTLLPFIRLPPEWQASLPGINWYHWLVGEPDGEAGVTVMIRLNQSAPSFIHLSPWEYRQLAEKVLDAHQLLQWLAYKLSGRETLIQTLLGMMDLTNEQEVMDKTLSARLEEQLMVVLEQSDTNFSLEFETHLLAETLSNGERSKPPTNKLVRPPAASFGWAQKDNMPIYQVPVGKDQSCSASGADQSVSKSEATGFDTCRLNASPSPGAFSGTDNDGDDGATPPARGSYTCSSCGRTFLTFDLLKKHENDLHAPSFSSGQAESVACASDDIKKESSEAELLDAAASGNIEQVQALLAQGVSPSAMSEGGQTPLHLAAQYGHYKLARLLFKFSLPADGPLYTPMHSAAEGGFIDIMDFLIAHYDVNARSVDQITPMHMASIGGHVSAMEWLMDKGAEVAPCDEDGQTPMHYAAEGGHVPAMEWLMDKGAEVASRDKDGQTPMHYAAQGGHVPAMEWLMDKGAEIALRDKYGLTPMHYAAQGGHVPAMEWLMGKGAEVAPRDKDGPTPMHCAAQGGHVPAMEWLMDKGAKIASRDEDGQTPMHCAAQGGHVPAMEWLMDKGAKIASRDEDGQTPMHYAAEGGHVSAMEWLMDKGAEIASRDKHGLTPMHAAAEGGHVSAMALLQIRGAEINVGSERVWTPLSYSCFSGHLEATKWLLAHGANINLGRPPYHAAARGGHVNLMIWLKDNNYQTESKDKWTAMHSAALGNQIDAMEWLLAQGERLDARNKDGLTPIYAAAMVGSIDAMKWLAEKGANVMVITKNGRTLMHAAAASGDLATMEWLLSKGVSINTLSKDEKTPLHTAITGDVHTKVLKSTWNFDAIKWLLDHGADMKFGIPPYFEAVRSGDLDTIRWFEANNFSVKRDLNGWTPMHSAALNNNTDVMEHLLELGADVNALNKFGHTPLYEAARSRKLKAIEWLLGHGAKLRRGVSPLRAAEGNKRVMELLVYYQLRQQ